MSMYYWMKFFRNVALGIMFLVCLCHWVAV